MKYILAVVAGLVVVATGAAAQQTVSVDADVTSVHAPDELPGTYRLGLSVETDPQGTYCACEETRIALGVETPHGAELWRHRPVSYAIAWDERAADGEREEHTRSGLAVIEADESLLETGDRTVTVTVEATNRGPADGRAAETEVHPATVELPPPEGSDEDRQPALAASQGGSAGSARAEPVAADDSPAAAGAAGLLALALSAGAVARLQ